MSVQQFENILNQMTGKGSALNGLSPLAGGPSWFPVEEGNGSIELEAEIVGLEIEGTKVRLGKKDENLPQVDGLKYHFVLRPLEPSQAANAAEWPSETPPTFTTPHAYNDHIAIVPDPSVLGVRDQERLGKIMTGVRIRAERLGSYLNTLLNVPSDTKFNEDRGLGEVLSFIDQQIKGGTRFIVKVRAERKTGYNPAYPEDSVYFNGLVSAE